MNKKHPKNLTIRIGKNIRRLRNVTKAAVLLSVPFTSVAEAQSIEDAVAITGVDNNVHISWENANRNVDFYVVRWGSGNQKTRICRSEWTNVSYNSSCNSYENFDGQRLNQTIDIQSRNNIQIRPGQRIGSKLEYFDWSSPVQVTDGLPVNLRAARSPGSDELNVTWDANPDARAEGVKYEVRVRPKNWVRNVGRKKTTAQTSITIDDYSNAFLPPYAVSIKAIYDSGETVQSGWINETTGQGDGPIDLPVATGDLTDQCRPNPIRNPEDHEKNVHDKIGAVGEYAEARIPLETQVWFFPTEESEGGLNTGENFGHAHLLTCVPHIALGDDAQIKSKTLRLDMELQAHLNEARKLDDSVLGAAKNVTVTIDEVEIRGRNNSGSDILVDEITFPALTCTAGKSCKFQKSVDIMLNESTNTADNKKGFETNGIKELRIAAIHNISLRNRPVAEARAIMRLPVDLNIRSFNGVNPVNIWGPITESSGWLIEKDRDGTGGYATLAIKAVDGKKAALPVKAYSKKRSPIMTLDLQAKADPCTLNCRADRMPVVRYWGFIDPHAHNASGLCQDASCLRFKTDIVGNPDNTTYTEQIDVRNLTTGMHRLVLAVEQPMIDGQFGKTRTTPKGYHDIRSEDFESTLTGLLILRFMVTD